jgi:hypothetical protein
MQYKQDTPSKGRHLNNADKNSVSYQKRNNKILTDKIIPFRGLDMITVCTTRMYRTQSSTCLYQV